MIFFVDDSWQTIDGQPVGALGAVALEEARYNDFCSSFYGIKQTVLGAKELSDSEIKGQNALAKAAFKREELHGDSHWLKAIDKLFNCLARFNARTFVIWTTEPSMLTLRNPTSTELSKPYKQLLFDFRAYMQNEAAGRLATLNFDLRSAREDEAAARAIENFMARTRGGWRDHFIQVPNFTVSSVSPGLQAADLVAYLGGHQVSSTARPELQAYKARLWGLRYEFDRGDRVCRSIRRVHVPKENEEPASQKL